MAWILPGTASEQADKQENDDDYDDQPEQIHKLNHRTQKIGAGTTRFARPQVAAAGFRFRLGADARRQSRPIIAGCF